MYEKSDHDPIQIIWIMGNSAAGKESFIYQCTQGNAIIDELGWRNKRIAVSSTSVTILGRSKNVIGREGIFRDIADAIIDHDVILVKWQYEDSETNRLEDIARRFRSSAETAIIQIVTEQPLLEHRLQNRPWWDSVTNKPAFIEKENCDVAAFIADAKKRGGMYGH